MPFKYQDLCRAFFLVLFLGRGRVGSRVRRQLLLCLLSSFLPFQGALYLFLLRFNIVTDYRTANHAYAKFQLETVTKHADYFMNPKMSKAVNKK